jgi:hypothetical protein
MTEAEQLMQALDVALEKLKATTEWKAWDAADRFCDIKKKKLKATPEYQAWAAVQQAIIIKTTIGGKESGESNA